MSQQRIRMVSQRTTYLGNGGCILLVCRYNMKILLADFTKRLWRRDVLHKTVRELIIRMGIEQWSEVGK
jgi:hypothetical protein